MQINYPLFSVFETTSCNSYLNRQIEVSRGWKPQIFYINVSLYPDVPPKLKYFGLRWMWFKLHNVDLHNRLYTINSTQYLRDFRNLPLYFPVKWPSRMLPKMKNLNFLQYNYLFPSSTTFYFYFIWNFANFALWYFSNIKHLLSFLISGVLICNKYLYIMSIS